MRDYAKKPQHHPIEPSNDHAWLNTVMLVLAFVFVLAAIIHFAEKQDVRPKKPAQPIADTQIKTQPQKIAATTHHKKPPHYAQKRHVHQQALRHQKTTLAANIQPKYDFYKLLPEMTVNVPAPAATTTNTTH